MAWNRRKKVRFARGMWVGRLVAVSVVTVAACLWYVWLRVQMVNVGYQMREKEQRLSNIKKENQVLRMKISQMKSPKNIEALIRAKAIDLTVTKEWQLVVLPTAQGRRSLNGLLALPSHPDSIPPGGERELVARVPMH